VIRLDTLSGHLDSLVTRMNGLRGRLRSFGNDSVVVRLDSTLTVYRDGFSRAWPEAATRIRQSLPMLYALGERSIAGADFTEMNAGLGRYFHTSEGLLVLQVAPGTPAARAGLQPGDVVQQANGTRVTSVRAFREAFARADGHEVSVRVLREGRTQQLRVQWEPTQMRGFRYDSEDGRLVPSTEPRTRERTRERTRTP
jgi:predicted metalloprotease with PDZ domain